MRGASLSSIFVAFSRMAHNLNSIRSFSRKARGAITEDGELIAHVPRIRSDPNTDVRLERFRGPPQPG